MKRLLAIVLLAGCLLSLNACLVAPVVPPIGMVFSDLKAPLDIDYDKTAVSGKQGVSESTSILGLVALGDASASAAAEQGHIKIINHADYEYYNVLGVYQRYRTVVYGE